MIRCKVSHPLRWVFYYLLVHAVLKVFLHVRVDEEVQTGKIAEGDVLGQTCALLVPQRLEQLVMQVADLLLRD